MKTSRRKVIRRTPLEFFSDLVGHKIVRILGSAVVMILVLIIIFQIAGKFKSSPKVTAPATLSSSHMPSVSSVAPNVQQYDPSKPYYHPDNMKAAQQARKAKENKILSGAHKNNDSSFGAHFRNILVVFGLMIISAILFVWVFAKKSIRAGTSFLGKASGGGILGELAILKAIPFLFTKQKKTFDTKQFTFVIRKAGKEWLVKFDGYYEIALVTFASKIRALTDFEGIQVELVGEPGGKMLKNHIIDVIDDQTLIDLQTPTFVESKSDTGLDKILDDKLTSAQRKMIKNKLGVEVSNIGIDSFYIEEKK